MPAAGERSSAGLSIELTDGTNYYGSGERLTGNVKLETAQDFAIGLINIEFYGRVKVYYVQSHGQGESHWRGRVPLFSESRTLYQGYHTHRPGSFSWPFEFCVPTSPDPAIVKQSKHQWKEADHFLSTDAYIPQHSIPGTFDFRKNAFGYRWHVFVEYVLKVEVRQAEGSRLLLPPKSRKATLPILVKHASTESPQMYDLPLAAQFTLPDHVQDKSDRGTIGVKRSSLQTQALKHTLRSSRLTLPKLQQSPYHIRSSSFSLLEKTKQLFNSSSLPRFTFEFSVSVPEMIQILQDNAIFFIVSARPVENSNDTSILPHDYPDICIDNLSILLTATTYLRCKGPFYTKSCSYDIQLLDRHPVDYILPTTTSQNTCNLDLDIKADTNSKLPPGEGHSTSTVDLSKSLNLPLTVAAAKMGKQIESPLSPTFNTYIIAREYKLKWKVELDIAGEKVKLQNKDDIPVKLVPPAAEALTALIRNNNASTPDRNDDNDEAREDDSDDQPEDLLFDSEPPTNTNSTPYFRRTKKTKGEEATVEHNHSSYLDQSLRLPEELLPTYEQAPRDFGYRNELGSGEDGRMNPPGYKEETE